MTAEARDKTGVTGVAPPASPRLPDPDRWRVVNESLSDACRRLVPFAVAWLDAVIASESGGGVIEDERARDEVAAIGAFLAACRAGGLAE